jgi:hypothetical protein
MENVASRIAKFGNSSSNSSSSSSSSAINEDEDDEEEEAKADAIAAFDRGGESGGDFRGGVRNGRGDRSAVSASGAGVDETLAVGDAAGFVAVRLTDAEAEAVRGN